MSQAAIDADAKATAAIRERQAWPPGPWNDGPDRVDFRHLGLPCMMRRTHLGVWCGYVAVPPGHPMHGRGYDDVPANVHGGLTHAGACSGAICHTADVDEPDDVWWFGFDCAHAFDFVPGIEFEPVLIEHRKANQEIYSKLGKYGIDVYRDAAYVRGQVESLAEQLLGMHVEQLEAKQAK